MGGRAMAIIEIGHVVPPRKGEGQVEEDQKVFLEPPSVFEDGDEEKSEISPSVLVLEKKWRLVGLAILFVLLALAVMGLVPRLEWSELLFLKG